MSPRRATKRAASAGLAVASVILLATCDLATLTKPNEGGTPGNPFDSTELTLSISGLTTVNNVATIPLLGTATMNVTSSSVSLANVVKRYYSSLPNFLSVDSVTGVATGLQLTPGTTVKLTAKVLAPELGAGVTISQQVRVRYKGIKVVTPVALDSMTGLGQTRTASYQGTNASNAVVSGLITLDSLRLRTGAGVIDTSSIGLIGNTLRAKKNGAAYLVAFFDGLRDSVLVRVRQVAKSITFPTTDYTARHVNFNLTVPFTAKDVQDSIIPTPTATWSTKNAANATVVAATGVLQAKTTAMTTADSVVVVVDTVRRAQRILVSQVVGSLTKFQGDARSDTVAKNVKVVPTVTVVDSGSTPIVGASVTFRVGTGLNASVNDTLPVTTNGLGRAAPTSWKIGDLVGTNNNTLIATSGSQSTTFTVSGTNSTAKKLAFIVSPTSASVNVAISPNVTVQVQDSLGNLVPNANNNITVALANNPGAASLAGTLTVQAVNGVASFGNLSLSAAGSGYTLSASASGLTSGTSNGFDIYGTATKLGFTTQPVNTSQGAVMSNVRVAIQDAAGNTVGNSTAPVTLAFSANPGSSTLGGTLTVQAVAGVATFSDLTINNAGNGYTFLATSAGLTQVVSNAFNVAVVGAAAKLSFAVQPSAVVAGATITPGIKVQVLDANGGLVTTSSQQVTLSIDASSPSGGSLGGTLPKNATSGEVTFSDITINKSGNAFKLVASAPGTALTTATSTAFNVSPGTANKLGFVQQPTHTIAGQTMSPAVTVEVQDINGNRVTTGTFSVSLTLGGCAGATLNGGGAVNTSSGVATFSSLSIAATVSGCTLSASATGLANSPVSTSFNSVASNGAVKLSFTTEPSASGTAGSNLATSPVINIQDNAGNNVTASSTASITLSVLSGPQAGFSGGGGTQNSTTGATFSGIRWNTAGTYRLLASAPGYRPDTSVAIVIGPSTAFRWGVTQQPTNAVAGVPFNPPLQVAVQDQFGNTVPGSTNTLSIYGFQSSGPCCIKFNQGPTITSNGNVSTGTAVNGVLTFTGLSVATAMKNLIICDNNPGALNGFCTGQFEITPAPISKLGFSAEPQYDTVGTPLSGPSSDSIRVSGQDSVGNTVSDFSNSVTVALSGGTSGATLGGTKIRAPVGGTAAFGNLTIDRVGASYQLTASASGVATATSQFFNIDPVYLNSNCCFFAEDMVVLGSTVYFVHNNALKSVPLAGGAVTTIVGSTNATRIATDGTNIFWAERGTNNNGDAFIKKLTVANLPTVTVTNVTTGLVSLYDYAQMKMYADATNVYFIARNQAGTGYAVKSIGVGSVNGTPVDLFTTGNFNNPPPYFTLSGGLIYFYDNVAGAIRRMTTAGASLTTLSSGSVSPERFALSGTTLVFNESVSIKTIASANTAVGPVTPTLAATATGTVYDVIADATNVWINSDGVLRKYLTSNFATFTDLVVNNGNNTPNVNAYYLSPLVLDGTNIVFSSTYGRIVKVPK